MKLLLDTHVLLWWLGADKKLSPTGQNLIASTEHTVFVSAATVWEIRIKEALGKLRVSADLAEALEAEGFESLSITSVHASSLNELPMHHRDPFDRILVAQAKLDGLTLVTHDEQLARYDVSVKLV